MAMQAMWEWAWGPIRSAPSLSGKDPIYLLIPRAPKRALHCRSISGCNCAEGWPLIKRNAPRLAETVNLERVWNWERVLGSRNTPYDSNTLLEVWLCILLLILWTSPFLPVHLATEVCSVFQICNYVISKTAAHGRL